MSGTTTLVTRLADWAAQAPEATAIHGGSPARGFTDMNWRAYEQAVRGAGKSLIALGVEGGDRITIIGRNRPEWAIADLGILAAGAVPTPIYATNTAEQVAWLVNHSEASIAFIDDEGQYEKFVAARDRMPGLKTLIIMGDIPERDKEWTLTWDEFLGAGISVSESVINERINSAQPDDLALLCYTSGTTGEPKGVMLTHANFNSMTDAILDRFPIRPLQERIVSYLPLCHVAEHAFTLLNQMGSGIEVYFCDDVNEVKDYLPAVRPTLFLAVPRVWEKFEAALRARLGEATGVKAALAKWALATESSWFRSQLEAGEPITGVTRVIANKLVIGKVKQALGMDEVWLCVSGAAPLSPQTADFFASLGLPIHEVYGMTETTAVISLPPFGQTFTGKVGKPLDCVEIRIADDGEVLAKGPNMTPGYFGNEEQTAELLDSAGWLHTGDIGVVDSDGFLAITDRKKELFKTSGGKYVAPAPIESRLKTVPEISQAVLVGDNEKFVGALVALDPEGAPALKAKLGLAEDTDPEALASHPEVIAYIEEQVQERVNADLARYEQVKKIVILPSELAPETGELTPTMKLRRKEIAKLHADQIASIFRG